MKHYYTIIKYRPDGASISRGCVMETSCSHFDIMETEDIEIAAKFIGEAYAFNRLHDDEFSDYEVTILVDGRSTMYFDDTERVLEKMDKIAIQHRDFLIQQAKIEEEQKQLQILEQKRKATEEEEKRMWQKLNAKYGA